MATVNYILSGPQESTTRPNNIRQQEGAQGVVLNSQFNKESDYIDVIASALDGSLLGTYNGLSTVSEIGTNVVYLDPLAFAKQTFPNIPCTLEYRFLRKVITSDLYISEISPDRLELKLASSSVISSEETYAEALNSYRSDTYVPSLLLELSKTASVSIINLDTSGKFLLVKLYSPLPLEYSLKRAVGITEEIADSVTFTVTSTITPDVPKQLLLRGPNFDIELEDQSDLTTNYLDYIDLLNTPTTSSFNRVYAEVSGSGVNLNVDYTSFSNFVHFSSAKERLVNFKYKLDLIHNYESAKVTNAAITNAATAVEVVDSKYTDLINQVVSNFDGYERHLYFESGSTSWPKSNSTLPYTNESSSTVIATQWFESQITSASLFDELNESRLHYTLPEYIRQDPDNDPAGLFLDMIGQHFDHLWVYAKGITDKYNADNRLDYGISKDLIVKTLQNFGVKLYSSNFAASSLSKSLLGEWYNSGSEHINTFVTASNEPTPDSDILHETYKRIYHNLPYLIKTKGTPRGLRALINCFGIPSGSIQVREFGGLTTSLDFSPGYSYPAQPDEKIRLENTGSLIPGDTLSYYTSTVKPVDKYTQDIHVVEVGFSPSYYIDEFITNYSLPPGYTEGILLTELNSAPGYRVDDYIGDPRNTHSKRHIELNKLRDHLLVNLERYDVYDFVRLIKFFDNQLFKMIKDFTPARDTVSTGIIIKPHILDRSKTGEPLPTAARYEYSGSISTAFIEGSEPGVIHNFSVAHSESISTALGYVNEINDTEVEKINGELGGTVIEIGLTGDNNFLQYVQPRLDYSVVHYTDYKDFADIEIPSSLFAGDIRIYVEAQTFTAPGELPEVPLDPSEPIGTPIPITITGLKDTCGKGSGTVKVGTSTVSNITANSGTSTVTISTTPVNVNSGDTVTLTLLAEGPTGSGCQQTYSSQTRARIIVNGTIVAQALSDTIDTATYTFTPTASTTVQFSYIQIPV